MATNKGSKKISKKNVPSSAKKRKPSKSLISEIISKWQNNRLAVISIIAFVLIGAVTLVSTRAATSNFEAEVGDRSKEVIMSGDPLASGGKFATFANPANVTTNNSIQRFPGDPNPLVTGKAYWGAGVGGNSDPGPRHEAPTDKSLSIRRTFWGWNHIGSNGSMTKTAIADLTANRLPWISVKPPTGGIDGWAGMANGTYDKDIDTMLTALDNIGGSDKPIWLTVHHEPENDNGNPAEWRGMQKRIRDRVNALRSQGKPMDNIAFIPIMMDWTYDPASGRNPNDWWVDGIWDAFGVDPYCYNTCSSKGKFILTMTGWNKFVAYAESKGLPIAIGEWGDTSTDAVAANNMDAFWAYPFKNKKDIIAYSAFDSGLNPPLGDPGVDTTLKGASLAKFQDILKNDQRVQRVNELKNGSTTTVSNYGTITSKVTLPEAGSYKVWARLKAASGTNAVNVQVDNGQVISMGGTTNETGWIWVSYKNGDPANSVVASLNSGDRKITITGTNQNVKIDRVMLTTENCRPEGTGDNCANAVVTDPGSNYSSVKIAAPTAGQMISGTQLVQLNTGGATVQEVSFRVDNVWQATVKSAPFEWVWDTTKFTNGQHQVVARVRLANDPGSIHSGDQIAATVNINNQKTPTQPPTPPVPPKDTESPTTPSGIRASLDFDWTRVSYTMNLRWIASTDNTGVSLYTIKRDGQQIGTSTTTQFADKSSLSAGKSYTYSISATDPAGNTSGNGTINLSTSCTFIFCSIKAL